MIDSLVVVGPFQCNCHILVCPKTAKAALIDPGDEPQKILNAIEKIENKLGKKLLIEALFHTHAHLDHIGGTRILKEKFTQSKIFLHEGDQELYDHLKMQGNMFGLSYDDPLPVDQYFEDEQEFRIGELRITLIHTPGHSPGSVCLQVHESNEYKYNETVFSGDTLFQGGVGRTDLWGGDQEKMFKSIKNRLLVLDDDIQVCPGHGPDTKIGIEKRENPFLV